MLEMRINEQVICAFELLEDHNEKISLKNLYVILCVKKINKFNLSI